MKHTFVNPKILRDAIQNRDLKVSVDEYPRATGNINGEKYYEMES